MFRFWERWGTALGIVAVVIWVIAFVFGEESPDTSDSDAQIASWFASNSHQNNQIIGYFLFLAGTLCVIGFFAAVRERMAADGHSEMGALAFGAGIASTVMSLVAITMFTAPAFLASDTGSTDVLPSTYRMLDDMGYNCWVAGATIGAIVVWGDFGRGTPHRPAPALVRLARHPRRRRPAVRDLLLPDPALVAVDPRHRCAADVPAHRRRGAARRLTTASV